MNNKNIIYIPCRKGSKRLKGKNRKLLGSIPLFLHTVHFALKNIEKIDLIVLDSDDDIILDNINSEKIFKIRRDEEFSRDNTSVFETMKNALGVLTKNYNEKFNLILLQVTNPFRTDNVFTRFKEQVFNDNLNVHISVTKVKKILEEENDNLNPVGYDIFSRSQDLLPKYIENGYYYYFPNDFFKDKEEIKIKKFIDGERFNFIDIDTQEDLTLANKLYENWTN